MLCSVKTKVDNLDEDKPETVSGDLIKLSKVVHNGVVKKTVHDDLVIKVNASNTKIPSTSGLVTKTQYVLYKQGHERR